LKDNTIVLLAGIAITGIIALAPWTDPSIRAAAAGALIGLVGGHLNGTRTEPAAA